MPIKVDRDIAEYRDGNGNLLVRRKGDEITLTTRAIDIHDISELLDALGAAMDDCLSSGYTDEDIKSAVDDAKLHSIRDGER